MFERVMRAGTQELQLTICNSRDNAVLESSSTDGAPAASSAPAAAEVTSGTGAASRGKRNNASGI
jgi:hypothetical protein